MPPIELWQNLAACDQAQIVPRTLARRSGEGVYELDVLDRVLRVNIPEQTVVQARGGEDEEPEFDFGLSGLMYLIRCQDAGLDDEWVSPKDLTGGFQFFRGPHALPTTGVAGRFGNDREGFAAAAEKLGGEPLEFKDASFRFSLFPRLPAAVVLWLGDDEFPARASIMVDPTAGKHLPLDALLGALGSLTAALVDAGG